MSAVTGAAAGAKGLWVAVGVLGAAVAGLGGVLVYQQTQSEPEQAPTVQTQHKPAAKQSAEQAAKPAAKPAAEKVTKAAPAKPVCVDCGSVTAVTPVEREGQASGTGAVAGGVLGAIVGNQIGQGQGKDVATIVGAIGGGIAGHQIEKKMKKVTIYQVELRMDDGSRRTLELATPPDVGARYRVDGANLVTLPAGQ